MYRTKCALKMINKSTKHFNQLTYFLVFTKTICGGCGTKDKSDLLKCLNVLHVKLYNVLPCKLSKEALEKEAHKQQCKKIV